MKYLAGTTETQGQRKNDFGHVPKGELVFVYGSECDREAVDGACGCRRAFLGFGGRATTTAVVVESDKLDKAGLAKLACRSLKKMGWVGDKLASEDDDKLVNEQVKEIVDTANAFPTGSVLERRGNTVRLRR